MRINYYFVLMVGLVSNAQVCSMNIEEIDPETSSYSQQVKEIAREINLNHQENAPEIDADAQMNRWIDAYLLSLDDDEQLQFNSESIVAELETLTQAQANDFPAIPEVPFFKALEFFSLYIQQPRTCNQIRPKALLYSAIPDYVETISGRVQIFTPQPNKFTLDMPETLRQRYEANKRKQEQQ